MLGIRSQSMRQANAGSQVAPQSRKVSGKTSGKSSGKDSGKADARPRPQMSDMGIQTDKKRTPAQIVRDSIIFSRQTDPNEKFISDYNPFYGMDPSKLLKKVGNIRMDDLPKKAIKDLYQICDHSSAASEKTLSGRYKKSSDCIKRYEDAMQKTTIGKTFSRLLVKDKKKVDLAPNPAALKEAKARYLEKLKDIMNQEKNAERKKKLEEKENKKRKRQEEKEEKKKKTAEKKEAKEKQRQEYAEKREAKEKQRQEKEKKRQEKREEERKSLFAKDADDDDTEEEVQGGAGLQMHLQRLTRKYKPKRAQKGLGYSRSHSKLAGTRKQMHNLQSRWKKKRN